MENIQNKVEEPENLTPEAKEAEEQALKVVDQAELRSQLIEKYGLDEEFNSELIDNLVKDKLEEQKKFSTAIKQKRSWREKAQEKAKTEVKPEVRPEKPVGDYVTKEELVERDIEALNLSDELKLEVKKYSKINGVSINEAAKSSYITFLKGKEEEKAKIDEASISGKRITQSKKDFSTMTPKDFDRSTPEGRKEWEDWKQWNKSQQTG
jgi:hypothetical protein